MRSIAPPIGEVHLVDPQHFDQHYREKYRHYLRKALYFALVEGPATTLRKYQSKRLERAIEGELRIAVATFHHQGVEYLGVTRRLGTELLFDPRLIFENRDRLRPDQLVLTEVARLQLESYLPVPSCPLDEALISELLRANRGLEPLAETACTELLDTYATEPLGTGRILPEPLLAGPCSDRRPATGAERVYLLGFGGYIREQVLPHFDREIALALDYRAELIREAGAEVRLTNSFDHLLTELEGADRPLVIVSTYHSDHTPMALRVLEANPGAHLFIEKPPVVEWSEVEPLLEARRAGAWIDIGFNRRYAPLLRRARSTIEALPRPLLFTALIKELKIPPTHWYHWPNQGTRITGNLCHWIDLAYHLIGGRPVELKLLNSGDDLNLAILFEDGSLANLIATDLGDDLPGVTERIEVRGGDTTVLIDDFRRLEISAPDRRRVVRSRRREKGHHPMYEELRERWRVNRPPLYPLDDLYWVPYLTTEAVRHFEGRRDE